MNNSLLNIFKEQGVVDIINDYKYHFELFDKKKKLLKSLKSIKISYEYIQDNTYKIIDIPNKETVVYDICNHCGNFICSIHSNNFMSFIRLVCLCGQEYDSNHQVDL